MNRLLALAHRYCQEFTLLRFSLLKTCCLAFGVMMGMAIPKKWRNHVILLCGVLFTLSYVPLMLGLIKTKLLDEEDVY